MSELSVGTLSGLAANSYEVSIASGSTLDLANAKASSMPDTALVEKPGLIHLASATMSAVASQSFDDVFTSTYDNYRIIFVGEASTLISLNFRLRAGGTDASGSDYTRQRIYASSTGITAARGTGTAYFPGDCDTDPGMMILELGNPAKASKTAFVGQNLHNQSTATAQIYSHTGLHGLTTAYDGFTLLPSSGTLTGTISVYGYRKA